MTCSYWHGFINVCFFNCLDLFYQFVFIATFFFKKTCFYCLGWFCFIVLTVTLPSVGLENGHTCFPVTKWYASCWTKVQKTHDSLSRPNVALTVYLLLLLSGSAKQPLPLFHHLLSRSLVLKWNTVPHAKQRSGISPLVFLCFHYYSCKKFHLQIL